MIKNGIKACSRIFVLESCCSKSCDPLRHDVHCGCSFGQNLGRFKADSRSLALILTSLNCSTEGRYDVQAGRCFSGVPLSRGGYLGLPQYLLRWLVLPLFPHKFNDPWFTNIVRQCNKMTSVIYFTKWFYHLQDSSGYNGTFLCVHACVDTHTHTRYTHSDSDRVTKQHEVCCHGWYRRKTVDYFCTIEHAASVKDKQSWVQIETKHMYNIELGLYVVFISAAWQHINYNWKASISISEAVSSITCKPVLSKLM